jgi:3'-phosphoadenosine 5'-phosphosulfate sulfotransferase (PAPS reductase)/FAD synthetase
MPEWAIRAEHFGLDPNKPAPKLVDYYTMQGKQGRTAFVTGVRANESMIRYRSCVQKLHENYIVTPFMLSKSIPLKFAKVIYDWTTEDVMKFIIDEHKAEYCEYYDLAELTGSNSRVGIPLHSVAIRRIGDVVVTEPEFYDQLVRCFPQIDAQRRYWADFDIESLISGYASEGWDGVKDCIDDHMLTPGMHRDAMKFASEFRKKRAVDPYGFPIEYLVRTLLLNEFHQSTPTPVGPKTRAHTMRMKAIEAGEDY